MYRYCVTTVQHPEGGGYCHIYDRRLAAECSLPLSEANMSAVRPLRWYYEGDVHGPDAFLAWNAAHRWMNRCKAAWGFNPRHDGPHPQDVDWQLVADHLREAARANCYR